jgi:DNA replication protein DnaC
MEQDLLLKSYLKRLRLPAMAQTYQKVAQEATQTNARYEQYLLTLLEQEILQRETNQQKRRLLQARFPVLRTLDSFDFSAIPNLNKAKVLDLTRGDYINKHGNVILVGEVGTGKTHVAISLGICACRQGKRVRFYTAAGLINEMIEAQAENRLSKLLGYLMKQHLVILDEVGFIPFSQAGAQLLFQFCAARHEQGSLLITTNLNFADWTQVFGDERLTAALLDRLTHHSTILEFRGESFRFKQSVRAQNDPVVAEEAAQPSE